MFATIQCIKCTYLLYVRHCATYLSLILIILLNKKDYIYFIAKETDSMRLKVTCPKTQGK